MSEEPMVIPAATTHIATDEDVLRAILTERLLDYGLEPTAPALDADGKPLLVWLNEVPGGENLHVSTLFQPRGLGWEPTGVEDDDIEVAFPVLVFLLNRATGIPEGTGVTFSG